jgi:ABC-type antimicrobial peptide transport system ATPase subunit
MSVLGLIPQPPGRIAGGEILFDGRDLLKLSPSELRQVRGRDIGMIFQDPMTSLNPVHKVGRPDRRGDDRPPQARRGRGAQGDRRAARARRRPERPARFDQYPHEWSGGMRQRAMIAMAIANQPKLLIADEPTTALDVTIQAQVLEVLDEAKEETTPRRSSSPTTSASSPRWPTASSSCTAGKVVETGDVYTIFRTPGIPTPSGSCRACRASTRTWRGSSRSSASPPSSSTSRRAAPSTPAAACPGAGSAVGRRCRRCSWPHPGHRSACHFAEEVGEELRGSSRRSCAADRRRRRRVRR